MAGRRTPARAVEDAATKLKKTVLGLSNFREHAETTQSREQPTREQAPPVAHVTRRETGSSAKVTALRSTLAQDMQQFAAKRHAAKLNDFLRRSTEKATAIHALTLPTQGIGVVGPVGNARQGASTERFHAERNAEKATWAATVQYETYAALRDEMWSMVRGRYHDKYEVPGYDLKKVLAKEPQLGPAEEHTTQLEHGDVHTLTEMLYALQDVHEPNEPGEYGLERLQKAEILEMLAGTVERELRAFDQVMDKASPQELDPNNRTASLDSLRIRSMTELERVEQVYDLVHLGKEINGVMLGIRDAAGTPLSTHYAALPERIPVARAHFGTVMARYSFDLSFMTAMGRYVAKEFLIKDTKNVLELKGNVRKDALKSRKEFFAVAHDLPGNYLLDAVNRLAASGLLSLYNEKGEVTALLQARTDAGTEYLSKTALMALGIEATPATEEGNAERARELMNELATVKNEPHALTDLRIRIRAFFEDLGRTATIPQLAGYAYEFQRYEGSEALMGFPTMLENVIHTRLIALAHVNMNGCFRELKAIHHAALSERVPESVETEIGLRVKKLIINSLHRTSSQDTLNYFESLIKEGLDTIITAKTLDKWRDRIPAHDIDHFDADMYSDDFIKTAPLEI